MATPWKPDWEIPVYPDGDYFSFLVPDMTTGTFGHPWEQSLCAFGDPLVDPLAATLAAWLQVLRRNGQYQRDAPSGRVCAPQPAVGGRWSGR